MKNYDRNALISLIESLNDIQYASEGCKALYFNLSRLDPQYRSDYQIRIAYNILADLLKNARGAIFLLDNADIVALFFENGAILSEKSLFQLRYLFMDDPLAYDAQGYENSEFCDAFDLSREWQRFYDLCLSKLPDAEEEEAEPELMSGDAREKNAPDSTEPKEPTESVLVQPSPSPSQNHAPSSVPEREEGKRLLLTPAHLEQVIDFIRRRDISSCFRRQPVCYVNEGGGLRPVYEEIYVDISALESMLPLPLDVRSNKILFTCLTEYLDRNMLLHLADLHRRSEGEVRPLSLNMNCRSLMTDAFARFDASVPPTLKKRIVVEIHVSDVFSDPASYALTRDLLQHKGYRICVDGADAFTFPQLKRDILGFDLVKLAWGADVSHAGDAMRNALSRAVAECGAHRVALCRCGQEKALRMAAELGVRLVQGRHVDALLEGARET
ncbi:MAG: hypothetical protein ABW189_07325 [Rickettsiales bacterium]